MDFEKYVLNRLDKINNKVNQIDRKIAYFMGGATIVATLSSLILSKLF